jgi:antitoxin VapB
MTLNIKREETHRLARRLADLTGENLTEAITGALREKVERIEKERSREERIERLLEIGRTIRAHVKGPVSSADLNDMFDENGLPK